MLRRRLRTQILPYGSSIKSSNCRHGQAQSKLNRIELMTIRATFLCS